MGLASPELHIERVRARVAVGGHDIPEITIRKRYDASRMNLIDLLPGLASVRVYDNSQHANPIAGEAPQPQLVLHMVKRRIKRACAVDAVPTWARPIRMAAVLIDPRALE
jgi:predicted ABC-type ATPase